MSALTKINGVWVNVNDLYVKRSGTWTKASEAYTRINGTWTLASAQAPAPPSAPVLSLEVKRDATDSPVRQWLRIGAVYPAGSDVARIRRIRVLWGGQNADTLSTQFGNNFITAQDDQYIFEPWSEWYYHIGKNGETEAQVGELPSPRFRTDSSVETFKQYPVNAVGSLSGNTRYYVGAWTLDSYGQWSTGVELSILVPAAGEPANHVVQKESYFTPWDAGTNQSTVFTQGDLNTRPLGPVSYGTWFYGNQITSAVGSGGTPNITQAGLRMTRNDDAFNATANVWVFWHGVAGTTGTFVPTSERKNLTKVGTIAKGQTSTFQLPDSFLTHYNTEIKGLGVAYDTSATSAADYLSIKGLDQDLRSGELHLKWTETV